MINASLVDTENPRNEQVRLSGSDRVLATLWRHTQLIWNSEHIVKPNIGMNGGRYKQWGWCMVVFQTKKTCYLFSVAPRELGRKESIAEERQLFCTCKEKPIRAWVGRRDEKVHPSIQLLKEPAKDSTLGKWVKTEYLTIGLSLHSTRGNCRLNCSNWTQVAHKISCRYGVVATKMYGAYSIVFVPYLFEFFFYQK